MAEQFYTILTNIGKAKVANALPTGTKVNLTKLKVGDSNGTYYNPSESQTDLVHKVYECNVTSVEVDKNNPSWITITAVIPSDVGGFSIREVGVFDDSNSLISIGKYPETYKPIASDGSTKELYIKMTLEVTNASSVDLKIDPTVILATKKDVANIDTKIEKVNTQLNDIMNKSISDFAKRLASENITRIKLIGDSITEGQGSSDSLVSTDKVILVDGSKTYYETDHNHKCWANYFRNYISRVSPSTEFLNYGIGGKTAVYINSKKEHLIDPDEDVVFVLLGTNDRFLTGNTSLSDLKSSLTELLNYIDAHSKLMIVLSPNTMNEYSDDKNTVVKTTNVNYTIEVIDRIIQNICIDKGYNFISLYKNFLKYCNDNKINYRYLLDEIGTNNPHPNDSGHELIWQILQQNLNIPDIKKIGMLDKLYASELELINGWSVSSSLNSPVFVARSKNDATITGIITGGTTTQGTVIATLPYQFRPNKQQSTYVKDWSNSIECVLTIKTNGDLIVGYNNNAWDNTKNMMLNFTYVLEV